MGFWGVNPDWSANPIWAAPLIWAEPIWAGPLIWADWLASAPIWADLPPPLHDEPTLTPHKVYGRSTRDTRIAGSAR